MDKIQGTTLEGSIPGNIMGGAVLVQGKLAYALSTNGINQAVDFGNHLAKCFHIPDACGAGSTFSYWLKWKSVSDLGVTMDSGGYYGNARGYAHVIDRYGVMHVFVKTSSHYYELRTSISEPEKWAFIVQTWSPSSGIKLYANGCILKAHATRSARRHAVSRNPNFVIGSDSIDFTLWIPMELDNFLSWDDELTEDEVWRLYVHTGQVKGTWFYTKIWSYADMVSREGCTWRTFSWDTLDSWKLVSFIDDGT